MTLRLNPDQRIPADLRFSGRRTETGWHLDLHTRDPWLCAPVTPDSTAPIYAPDTLRRMLRAECLGGAA